jgi:hydrogenase expression/formation protein HypC
VPGKPLDPDRFPGTLHATVWAGRIAGSEPTGPHRRKQKFEETNMCLAVPMQIKNVDPPLATVEVAGVRREVNIELLDDVKEQDYVIIHAGYAIEKLHPEEALETLDLLRQVAAAEGHPATAEAPPATAEGHPPTAEAPPAAAEQTPHPPEGEP